VVLLQAVLLGVVQGLTEFLPVSSSAHLILARAFFGFDAERFGLAFDVACHAGTLAAILAYFRRDLLEMVRAVPRAGFPAAGDVPARLIWLVGVGTIPAVIAGGLAGDAIDAVRSPVVIAVTLGVGGLLMVLAERIGRQTRGDDTLTLGEALAIGVAQACALVPGVSRSGATITLGLVLGLRREAAAHFSFLLSVPVMVAASGLEAIKLAGEPMDALTVRLFAAGMLASGIVGYLTIRFFLRYLAVNTLGVFAGYRIALAAATCVWLLF